MFRPVFNFSTHKPVFGSAYVVAAKRTPIGTFLGKLSQYSGPELGSFAVKGALTSINLDAKEVDEVILGNVVSAGQGQAPARQAALKAGLLKTTPCTTINKVCSSGMKTIMLGSQSIALGQNHCVVVGGFQSMSNAPFYVTGHRKGHSYGDQKLVDSLSHDGLTDAFNNIAMGVCAEKTVADFKMTREHQDSFAVLSYNRVIDATKSGKLKDEIVPVPVGKEQELLHEDEEYKKFNKDKMLTLKAAFGKNGTITAGNASKLNDGAASLILMSEQKYKSLGLKPLGRVVSYADAEIDPIDFCIAPHYAGKKALQRAGLTLSDISFFEFNEAFSATVIANLKLMDIPVEKVNVHGGAVALGHPIGMSGARIVQSLLNVLHQNGAKYGMAAICNGGGGASALIVQNLRV